MRSFEFSSAIHGTLLCIALALASCASASGQEADAGENAGPQLDKALTQRWQCGIIAKAVGGPCTGLRGTIPIPTEWPEQQVKVVAEDGTRHIRQARLRTLEGGVQQLQVDIPLIPAGDSAEALITLEITRHTMLPPPNPGELVLPPRLPRDVMKYLAPSPYIESQNADIRALSKDIVADLEGDWERVEAIYDWVRDNVEYREGKLKGALAALRDKNGDCEELTSLFIALCRAQKIPARTVWVPDHCYPEFYLQDQEGRGYWIPCQAAGTREFGGISELRPILQKGDNFKVPEHKTPQRYVAEHLTGKTVPGGGKPEVEFVRKLLAGE